MLSDDDIAALAGARHADPFAVLGPHGSAAGAHAVRAMLPGSTAREAADHLLRVGIDLVLRYRHGRYWLT